METPVEELPLALEESVRRHDDEWRIVCGQCDGCQRVVFPRPDICPHCLGEAISEKLVGPGGRVYTYTTVHAVRAGWTSPYHLAYVDFPEGVRVCGPLDWPEGAGTPIGALVDVAVGVLRADPRQGELFSHRFVLSGPPADEVSK